MNEEQQILLRRRLQEAADEQPAILDFRDLLLSLGGEDLVPSPAPKVKYFGSCLRGADADRFADTYRGDSEARYWRRLSLVFFRLQKDEDGYPERDWEGLKAEPGIARCDSSFRTKQTGRRYSMNSRNLGA